MTWWRAFWLVATILGCVAWGAVAWADPWSPVGVFAIASMVAGVALLAWAWGAS